MDRHRTRNFYNCCKKVTIKIPEVYAQTNSHLKASLLRLSPQLISISNSCPTRSFKKLRIASTLLLLIDKCICDPHDKACSRVLFQHGMSRGRSVLPASVKTHTVPRKTPRGRRPPRQSLACTPSPWMPGRRLFSIAMSWN